MRLLTRKLLLICLMLWLPLQGYAATVMPFCAHSQQDQHASHQMQDDQSTASAAHDQHHGTSNAPCDNCSLCHLCSSMALPNFAVQAQIKPDTLFNIPPQAAFSPFFPEQPQRPPLALTV